MSIAKRSSLACCAAIVLSLLGSRASAIAIPSEPGTYTLPGFVISDFSGPVVFTSSHAYSGDITTLFTIDGQQYPQVVSVSGSLLTTVVRDTASGTLDYYYSVSPSDNTYLGAGLVLDNLPTNPQLDAVAWFTSPPAQVQTLTVLSPGDIQTNIASLMIHTSLTDFVETYAPAQVQISNGVAGEDMVATQALIPAVVPEPSSIGLLSLALVGLLWKRDRSRALS